MGCWNGRWYAERRKNVNGYEVRGWRIEGLCEVMESGMERATENGILDLGVACWDGRWCAERRKNGNEYICSSRTED